MQKKISRLERIRENAQALLDERTLASRSATSRLHRFAHFWVLVGTSFSRNRCPVRAAALAYGTLLALIPMLAVVVSITSSFLKNEGEERIDQFVGKLVASLTPPAVLSSTNRVGGSSVLDADDWDDDSPASQPAAAPTPTNALPRTTVVATNTVGNQSALSEFAKDEKAIAARKEVARQIHRFIQNTRSGALGVTGSVVLIFVAISMLSRIEETFNDIWGVTRGRGWFMRIVLYWGVLSLAPILLVVALGLATGPHLAGTRKLLTAMPFVGNLTFEFLPVLVLCLSFALFYMLIPNTKVHWKAALAGGTVSGILMHLNNLVSVLYVSSVVSNSKIYGSLGLVPVFIVGLYLAWTILLFGAQVAYAFQNRASYLEEHQVERINQRGREFVALRLITAIGRSFEQGQPPPSIAELGEELGVPTRLARQIIDNLAAARLVVEAAGPEPAYLPARRLETMTCHDILLAMRAMHGQELATRDEPTRADVLGEFHRIEEAERQAASSVTLLDLVNRSSRQLPEPVNAPDAERS